MSFESLLGVANGSAVNSELDSAYDGTRRVGMMGLNVSPKMRALEVQVNWPRLTVDTMSEVLTVEGFESASLADNVLDSLKDTWNRENMTALSHLAHTEAMVQGEAFILVGQREDGSIRTTLHAKSGIAVVDDADGRTAEAVVAYAVPNDSGGTTNRAAYYTAERIEVFQEINGRWGRVSSRPGVGIVPVIPVRNALRVTDVSGRSEIDLVKNLGDAASRAMTMLQVAMELLAIPQRWIAGVDTGKLRNQHGVAPTMEQLYLGSYMFAPESDARMGQFAGADLSQIIAVIKTCAEQVSALTGIPPSMLGLISTGNPNSAEAMRAAKERLISRGEFKQAIFGDVWEQWARVVLAFEGQSEVQRLVLNTVWRDIAVSSVSAQAANLLQAHAQGIVTARTARDGLQLTPEQKQRENRNDGLADEVGAPGPLLGVDEGTVPVPDGLVVG